MSLVEISAWKDQFLIGSSVGGIFPWSSIDLRPAQGPLLENEYGTSQLHENVSSIL